MAAQGSHGDPTTIKDKKQAVAEDVFQLFAENVRDSKELETRWALVEETRLKYLRGKDFVSLLRSHPELKDVLAESDRSLAVEDIANVLLTKSLLVRYGRVVKTVGPGKKKLSAWPTHLEPFPDQLFSDNDAFFAWTFVEHKEEEDQFSGEEVIDESEGNSDHAMHHHPPS